MSTPKDALLQNALQLIRLRRSSQRKEIESYLNWASNGFERDLAEARLIEEGKRIGEHLPEHVRHDIVCYAILISK